MIWESNEYGPTLRILNISITGLSLLSSSWMILRCSGKELAKSISLKVFLSIAVSDFIYSTSNVIATFENGTNETLCSTEALIRRIFMTCSMFWITFTAILSYKASALHSASKQTAFFEKACLINILASLTMSIM